MIWAIEMEDVFKHLGQYEHSDS